MSPNTTLQQYQTEVRPYKIGVFQEWITFLALGGLFIDEDDQHIYRMTLTQFCERMGVARSTVNHWRKNTTNLAQLIEQRRGEIAPMARVSAMFNQLFLTGMQSKDLRAAVDAQKTFLGHFGNLQLPVQRQDIKIQGGLAEVLTAAEADGILEGEIVEPANIDAPTGGETPGPLPPAS